MLLLWVCIGFHRNGLLYRVTTCAVGCPPHALAEQLGPDQISCLLMLDGPDLRVVSRALCKLPPV